MSDYEFGDDLDLVLDDEAEDTPAIEEFVGSRSVILGTFDTTSMAQATTTAMVDDTLRAQLELIEMVRQTLGPKDQLVAQMCDEFEATLRTLTLEWAKFPERPLVRTLRAMDDVTRTAALDRIHDALTTVFGVTR